MKLEDGFYHSPRWTWEILDCAMPMTFDTYSNCAHQCIYCFAYFQRAVHPAANATEAYLSHKVKAVDVERVKRLFRLEPGFIDGAKNQQFAWYIKNRYVLQWGGLSDGFDWYERKFRKSLELLKFFVEIDYPVSISTKGTWFVYDDEYRAVLRNAKNVHFKYSIITDIPEHAKKLEAGTPSPDERFRAMEELNKLGIGATTLRFRPFVIGSSEQCIDRMFDRAKETGVYSITTEFLCLEKRAGPNHLERYRVISDVVGYDVWDFYRANSYSGSGLMRLNYDIKRPYIAHMEAKAAELNIPFYVSDAHHKESSLSGGCCGLPMQGPLSNYNKGQFTEAMVIAKRNGEVYWSDIATQAEGLKNVPFVGSEGFNTGSSFERAKNMYKSMYDYMHDAWNNTKSWMSPARYFGGALVPAGKDENGDVIYLYNKPFIEDGIRPESVTHLIELIDQQQARKDDGSDLGHIAYPICINAESPHLKELVASCEMVRANYTVFGRVQPEYRIPSDTDTVWFDEDIPLEDNVANYARDEGWSAYWWLEGPLHLNGYSNLRAALSAAEGGLVDGIMGCEFCEVGALVSG